jgi:ABC-type multidrug transport system fused ATPase/permease subunit
MKVERFFSYDVFVGGLFGIKSFLFLVFILITISAIYLWGFILILRRAVVSKSRGIWFVCFVCFVCFVFFLVSLFFHAVLYMSGLSSGKPERIIWLSVLGFIFAMAVSSYMTNPLKNVVSNWVAPIFGIVASATLPIVFADVTSDIVKKGLENFRVGGSVDVSVHKVENGDTIKAGKLLLLTPQYAYLREGDSGYISISRNNDTYVSVH